MPCRSRAGILGSVSWPQEVDGSVRVDTWVDTGTTVTPYYDSLLAKLMVYAPTRPEAIQKLNDVLAKTEVRARPPLAVVLSPCEQVGLAAPVARPPDAKAMARPRCGWAVGRSTAALQNDCSPWAQGCVCHALSVYLEWPIEFTRRLDGVRALRQAIHTAAFASPAALGHTVPGK